MKKEVKTQLENANNTGGLKRRNFVKILGGGIFIFFQPWNIADLFSSTLPQPRTLTKDYNAFLHIAENGMINCITGKVELGQGIIISLAQMMADELNVQVEKIKMIMGDTELCPYDAGTWGSQSIQTFGPAMRAAAAEARGALLDLASERLKVPVSQLDVKDGIVYDTKKSGNRVSYASLAKGKKIERYLDVKPAVEEYTKFTYIGKSLKRTDYRMKVTGEAKYAGDYKLPGMMFARILRPPSHGAKLTSVDTSGAEQVKGTQVVREGDFIAVLNEDIDLADEALIKIKAEYTFNELNVDNKSVYDRMTGADSVANIVRTTGDLVTGSRLSDKLFESEFHDPYVAHAPIETHTALAVFEGDKLTVWAATQTPFGLQDGLCQEFGMPLEKVRVIAPFIGGGFGGKGAFHQGIEAARLAKLSGKPVMLFWTREEEFLYDIFHPAGVYRVRSGMDKTGKIQMWDYKVYYGGTRGSDTIYDVPHATTTSYGQKKNSVPVHPFYTGAWRAPNNNSNTFARESQIDIMASAAGIDPLEFRLKNLKDEKMIDCLKSVADKFGYVPSKTPSGRGIGIACGHDAGTWVAMIAEIRIDKMTGKIKVVRVTCTQDMGLCVNPGGAIQQMEGSIIMSLGYTLTEEVSFEGGKVLNRGFDTYEIPRFSWLPKIECVILDRKDKPPKGGGEPAIITLGAVVANAVHDATGARMYSMPFTPERVLEALKMV